jgi:hypothetical protein
VNLFEAIKAGKDKLGAAYRRSIATCADNSIVYLYDSPQTVLKDIVSHSLSNPLGYVPRRLVSNPNFPLDLLGGDTFGGVAHKPYCEHPTGKINVRFVEDSPGSNRKLVTAFTLPLAARSYVGNILRPATWAYNTVRPSHLSKVLFALDGGGKLFLGFY